MLIKNKKHPPKKQNKRSVFSFIRHICFIANSLSIKQRKKEMILITIRYIKKYCIKNHFF